MSGLLGEALLSCMGSAFTIVGEIMGANHFLGLLYEGAHDLNPENRPGYNPGINGSFLLSKRRKLSVGKQASSMLALSPEMVGKLRRAG